MNQPDHFTRIRRLKSFNAKERYWVVSAALGHFKPSSEFLIGAAKAAGVPPPSEDWSEDQFFLAMDYHFNWLCAALWETMTPSRKPGTTLLNLRFTSSGEQIDDREPRLLGRDRALMENSQEDVDLLLAYPRVEGGTQLILVEAKCAGTFTPKQLDSKLTRLRAMLNWLRNEGNISSEAVDVKMILMSPSLPSQKALEDVAKLNSELNAESQSRVEKEVPWLLLEPRSPGSEGFWLVKFGGSGKESDESRRDRQRAGKAKASWYWPEASLQFRASVTAKKRKNANE